MFWLFIHDIYWDKANIWSALIIDMETSGTINSTNVQPTYYYYIYLEKKVVISPN